jgi:hypothetical protein
MAIRNWPLPLLARKAARNAEAGTTHPALPAVVLLVCLSVFMAAIAPLDFSQIIRRWFPPTVQAVPHQDAAVWIDSRAGVYYCSGSMMFGKTPGQYATQVAALDHGYQPALGTYCTGPAWNIRPQPLRSSTAETTKAPAPRPAPKLFENPQSQLQN